MLIHLYVHVYIYIYNIKRHGAMSCYSDTVRCLSIFFSERACLFAATVVAGTNGSKLGESAVSSEICRDTAWGQLQAKKRGALDEEAWYLHDKPVI